MTRTRSNTRITVLDQLEVTNQKTADGQIISDQQVILGGGINYSTERFRLVTILTKGQRLLRLVTNRFDVSPNEVADMYQARWQIELFFKHLKQNIMIRRIYSQKEQGAINQVILTLIATLLTFLIKIQLGTTATLFALKRSLHYLMFAPAEYWFAHYQLDG
ncbi:transposase [Enterococcus sp. DIV0187]